MTQTSREALLSRWIKPSSDDEKIQQDRAQRMVIDAVRAHAPLKSASLSVFAKGSYPNNTNVRRDSDVDIAVQSSVCQYYHYMPGRAPAQRAGSPYQGEWTPARLRTEVKQALVDAFGASSVTSGKIALTVSAVAGSRPSVDVVPSFDYVLYSDPQRIGKREGSCVFPQNQAMYIVNWPSQQLVNGRAKNTATGGRYKNFARALKSAENELVKNGIITDLPSYFMECLAWNVADDTLRTGNDLSTGFRATLYELWNALDTDDTSDWTEPNDIKYLFRPGQSWTQAQAKRLILETWKYLDY